MRKEVVGNREQKVQRYMGLKLTLHLIYTLILSSFIHSQQIPIMKLCTKSISANSTISQVEPLLAYHPRRWTKLHWTTIDHQQRELISNISYIFWVFSINCRPKALSSIKPFYTFAVRRTGLPEVKTIYQHRHFCPCAPCTTGDFHHCLYQQFLGMSHLMPPAFLGERHNENMEINYVHENPRAVLRQEHAATIRLRNM